MKRCGVCRPSLFLALAAAVPVFMNGCAANPRAGFPQVRQMVQDRIGQAIVWRTGGVEDQEVDARVQEMLREPLTVEHAVEIALLNSPDLQASYEELGIAQADLVQAGLLANPVISANLRFPGRPHYPFEVNVEEDFIELLFLPLRKKVAAADFARAQASVSHAVLERAGEVRTAYYKLQGAQQLLELRRTVLEAAQASAEAARRLREAGNTSDLDYANHQGMLAQARIDVAAEELEMDEDREELGALMGVWGPAAGTWRVEGRLAAPEATDIPLAGLESKAIAQRQDLAAARQSALSAARTAGFANAAALFSGASVGIDASREPDVKSTIGPAIIAPLPIFDQGQAAGARALAQFRQAQAQYQALAIRIRSQVHKSYYRLAAARERALYYRDVVIPLRRRIVEQTQLQYNGMFVGIFGLLQAKQEEINAGVQYVEALRDYWVAHAELELALGGRLPGASTTSTAPGNSMSPDTHQHFHGGPNP